MKVELGDIVKDPVTGIEGIAYCYITYLQGCERIGIQEPSFKKKDGERVVPDLFHVDEPQLEIVKKTKVKKQTGSTGGPSEFNNSHMK